MEFFLAFRASYCESRCVQLRSSVARVDNRKTSYGQEQGRH